MEQFDIDKVIIKMTPETSNFIKSFNAIYHCDGAEYYFGNFSFYRTPEMEPNTYKLTPLKEQRKIRRNARN